MDRVGNYDCLFKSIKW